MAHDETKRNGTNGMIPLGLATLALDQLRPAVPASPVAQMSPLIAIVTQPDGSKATVTAEIVLVTPQMAAAWLGDEARGRNRKSSDKRVAMYARDMAAGKWRVTNQGLGFDSRGRLIDGEHRCHAIVATGTPVALLVVRGLPSETQNNIDILRPRSMAEQYGMWTGTERSKDRAAAAKIIRLITTGVDDGSATLTFDEQGALIVKYRPELDWALGVFVRRSGLSALASAPIVGAWAYAYGASNDVGRWVLSYLEGSGLERGDPLLALRNHMLRPEARGLSTRRLLVLKALRALWAKLNGEKLSKLYDNSDGLLGFARLRGDTVPECWSEWSSKPGYQPQRG